MCIKTHRKSARKIKHLKIIEKVYQREWAVLVLPVLKPDEHIRKVVED